MTFSFHEQAQTFDAHIAAHLPGYDNVQHLVALVAAHVVGKDGLVVDVGCSTGTTIQRLRERLDEPFDAVGYDIEESMLQIARERIGDERSRFVLGDVSDAATLQHSHADLTLLLWTLQFMAPEQRTPLLQQLRRRAAPDGVLLIAAKTRLSDPRWEEVAVAALDEYKESNGVSAQERADKTRALRGYLRTETTDETVERLHRAGWASPALLFRWHVWVVLGAFARPLAPNRFV